MTAEKIVGILRRAAAWLFPLALAVVVWGELKPSHHGPEGLDKLLHFIAYFGLAGIASVALGRTRPALWAALALAAFGGVLEIVQSFVGRDAEWGDELANISQLAPGRSEEGRVRTPRGGEQPLDEAQHHRVPGLEPLTNRALGGGGIEGRLAERPEPEREP